MGTDTLVYIGVTGLLIGIVSALFIIFRRLRWMGRRLRGQRQKSIKLAAGLRNLLLLFFIVSTSGMLLFAGFFFTAYHAFTTEIPVAEVEIQPLLQEKASRITLKELGSPDSQAVHQYLIRGDQWLLEGDILKWDNWLNFLGLQTRYRLTRIRGRYLNTEEEIQNIPTIYSLIERENEFMWEYLYEYGPELPFVSSVYGNAVFQNAGKSRHFIVFVTTSGFMAREIIK